MKLQGFFHLILFFSIDKLVFPLKHEKSYSSRISNFTTVIQEKAKIGSPSFRFIHVPKSGTTFAASVIHYCCEVAPRFVNVVDFEQTNKICRLCIERHGQCFAQPHTKNGDFLGHIPHRSRIDNGKSLIMLRNPKSRLASQLHMMHLIKCYSISFGLRQEDCLIYSGITWQVPNRVKLLASFLNETSEEYLMTISLPEYLTKYRYIYNSDTLRPISNESVQLFLDAFRYCDQQQSAMHHKSAADKDNTAPYCKWHLAALYPGLLGCQTKLILGRTCFDNYAVTDEDLQEAKRRLREEFLFIGITDFWNISIALFHEKFGGHTYVEEIYHQREAKLGEHEKHQVRAHSELVFDRWDEELYAYGVSLFKKDLIAHHLDANQLTTYKYNVRRKRKMR